MKRFHSEYFHTLTGPRRFRSATATFSTIRSTCFRSRSSMARRCCLRCTVPRFSRSAGLEASGRSSRSSIAERPLSAPPCSGAGQSNQCDGRNRSVTTWWFAVLCPLVGGIGILLTGTVRGQLVLWGVDAGVRAILSAGLPDRRRPRHAHWRTVTSVFGVGMVTIGLIVFFLAIGTLQRPPVESVQRGYRGLGMVSCTIPPPSLQRRTRTGLPEASPNGTRPRSTRIAGLQQRPGAQGRGCRRVHPADDGHNRVGLATARLRLLSCRGRGPRIDKLYTKVDSRRMIEMTRHINADWQKHVGETGVACYHLPSWTAGAEQRLVQRSWADRVTRRRGKSCWATSPTAAVGLTWLSSLTIHSRLS